ncbi:MAG: GNAT family N-acetyltransferase [Pararhizobium sp.]
MLIEFKAAMKDGTPVLIRTVRPSDRGMLLEGFERLSDRSRLFRFMAPTRRLSEANIARFTAESTPAHYAAGALDLSADPPLPVAIARYERLGETSSEAEMAVTVVDSHQQRGLGTLLFAGIAIAAAEAGITAFLAFVHAENHSMARLIRSLGGRSEGIAGNGYEFRIPIAAQADIYPATSAGDAVRAAYRVIAAQR